MNPVDSSTGFSSEIELTGLAKPDAERIRCVLNAAATMGTVEIEREDAGRYGLDAQSARTSKRFLIRPELTLCLSDIRRRIASEAVEAGAHTSRLIFSWNRKKTVNPQKPATGGSLAPVEPAQEIAPPPRSEFGQRQPDVGGSGLAPGQSNVRNLLRTVVGTRTAAKDEAVSGATSVNRSRQTDVRRDGEETRATDLPPSDRRQSLGDAIRRAIGRDIADDIERAKSETDHSDKS
jgi:hypothetical protein